VPLRWWSFLLCDIRDAWANGSDKKRKKGLDRIILGMYYFRSLTDEVYCALNVLIGEAVPERALMTQTVKGS